MKVETTEGECAHQWCHESLVVGLQSKWYCLTHFEERLGQLRQNLDQLNDLIERSGK